MPRYSWIVLDADGTLFDFVFSRIDHPQKSTVLMVGDSLTSDIAGGLAYGLDTCWFNPKQKDQSSSIKPTYEIEDLDMVIEIAHNGRAKKDE